MPSHGTPLVSVIIPAYNAERYVARALRSVLAQTYSSVEVIAVDDGSTDATDAVIRSFSDPRIRHLRQTNTGQGAARNRGIRASTGKYVTFLDADDAYLPEKVRRQVAFLEAKPEHRVVFCEALHFYSRRPTMLLTRRRPLRTEDIFRQLLHASFINPNTLMIDGGMLREGFLFSEERYYPEEWDLCLRLARAGCVFGYLPEALVVVELREGSNTAMGIQWMLKRHTLEMFERLFAAMSAEERAAYGTDRILRACQIKLVVAALTAPRAGGAARAVSRLPLCLRYPATAAQIILPEALLRSGVEAMWRWRQRRSFAIVHDRAIAAAWADLLGVPH